MKCLICEKYGWNIICKVCLEAIPITPRSRIVRDSIYVYSFYRYEDVAFLMQSKYHLIGSRILTLLAQNAAKYFFSLDVVDYARQSSIPLIGLDDYPYGAYSHVGVIARAFAKQSKGVFKAYHGVLKAQNNVKYAGQNLHFRVNNPKGFVLKRGFKAGEVVLLDDIITTGTSLSEAIGALEYCNVLFCITLCDAK
ncbi:phosphoribosyltransferase [Helicobacter marmotae]|uniref:Phosphoribosyltransferase n=1 Tax=Helicobacter marmotae TaxID=152490 RepID=A0A3D8I3F9_9HELI|nr:phosphoribosyltransferase [Helicobacter marmotae]RDU59141.1 phosphoribosyltransferase [Helicobacter marmotae]